MPTFKFKAYSRNCYEAEIEAKDESEAWEKAKELIDWNDVTDERAEGLEIYDCEEIAP